MKIMLSILWALLLVGCASSSSISLQEKNNQYNEFVNQFNLETQASINGFKFYNWQSLSDKFLIINVANNKNYLIKVKHSCADLSSAQAIHINRTSYSRLYRGVDSISPQGFNQQRCFIDTIYPITAKQKTHLIDIGKIRKQTSSS